LNSGEVHEEYILTLIVPELYEDTFIEAILTLVDPEVVANAEVKD